MCGRFSNYLPIPMKNKPVRLLRRSGGTKGTPRRPTKSLDEIRHALSGPIASVSTPFTKDGRIDFRGLGNFIDFVIAGGSRTVLLTYGDSLYSLLTDDEVAE